MSKSVPNLELRDQYEFIKQDKDTALESLQAEGKNEESGLKEYDKIATTSEDETAPLWDYFAT